MKKSFVWRKAGLLALTCALTLPVLLASCDYWDEEWYKSDCAICDHNKGDPYASSSSGGNSSTSTGSSTTTGTGSTASGGSTATVTSMTIQGGRNISVTSTSDSPITITLAGSSVSGIPVTVTCSPTGVMKFREDGGGYVYQNDTLTGTSNSFGKCFIFAWSYGTSAAAGQSYTLTVTAGGCTQTVTSTFQP